jgi:hypothetical protein
MIRVETNGPKVVILAEGPRCEMDPSDAIELAAQIRGCAANIIRAAPDPTVGSPEGRALIEAEAQRQGWVLRDGGWHDSSGWRRMDVFADGEVVIHSSDRPGSCCSTTTDSRFPASGVVRAIRRQARSTS